MSNLFSVPPPTIVVTAGTATPSVLQYSIEEIDVPTSQPSNDSAWLFEAETDAAVGLGQPIIVQENGNFYLAQADSAGEARVKGLSVHAALAGQSTVAQGGGILTLTNWSAATGSTLLTLGEYFLAFDNPGQMTRSPPAGAGRWLVSLGSAISSNEFLISIQRPIRL